jgi:hypothetical protein
MTNHDKKKAWLEYTHGLRRWAGQCLRHNHLVAGSCHYCWLEQYGFHFILDHMGFPIVDINLDENQATISADPVTRAWEQEDRKLDRMCGP